MIEVDRLAEELQIVLSPNRSMSWQGNKIFLLSMLVLSALIAGGFAMVGAWVILPFAGLEMLILTIALYYVSWKLSYREVMRTDGDKLIVEKGYYRPRKSWQLLRQQVSLNVEPEAHPWSTPSIHLQHQQELIEIGEFLNKDDCDKLLKLLRELGLRTSTSGTAGKLSV